MALTGTHGDVTPLAAAGSGSHALSGAVLGRIAIVAGGGQVPSHLVRSLRAEGQDPFVVMLSGHADPALAAFPHVEVDTAEPGRLLRVLRAEGIKTLVLVGSVKGRPDISRFRPDFVTIRIISRLVRGLAKGDDALLRMIVDVIEEYGFTVVGAHEVAPDLLAPFGAISGSMSKGERGAIHEGVRAATILGRLDAGQAVVVVGHRAVALEGVEGTDAMLARVAELRANGRISRDGGVLVKLKKPQQDERVDLPTIGVATVENAARAGLSGIIVQGEATLIVDAQAVRSAAQKAGVFITGIDPAEYGHE